MRTTLKQGPPRSLGLRLATLTTCVALACVGALLSFTLRPSLEFQHYDSLWFPTALDSLGLRAMNANHGLSDLIAAVTLRLARLAGYEGRSFVVMVGMSAIFFGLSVALFFLMTTWSPQTRVPPRVAASLTALGSFGYAHFGGTADIYTVAFFFTLLACFAATRCRTTPRFLSAGLRGACVGVGVLAHHLNVVLVPVSIVTLWRHTQPGQKVRAVRSFLTWVAFVALVGSLAIGAMATSSLSPPAWCAG